MGLRRAFSDSSSLQSVFENLRLRDGLVWTAGQTGGLSLDARLLSSGFSPVCYHVTRLKCNLLLIGLPLYISNLQIQVFIQDLTQITNEIKRSETAATNATSAMS